MTAGLVPPYVMKNRSGAAALDSMSRTVFTAVFGTDITGIRACNLSDQTVQITAYVSGSGIGVTLLRGETLKPSESRELLTEGIVYMAPGDTLAMSSDRAEGAADIYITYKEYHEITGDANA